MTGMFKMGQSSIGQGAMGTSRMFSMQKNANSSNPMLLSVSFTFGHFKKSIGAQ